MDEKDIEKIKKIEDAKKDLDKLDEILSDSTKFRQQSNKVYDDITHKLEYEFYIAAARLKYKLANGNMRFKDIPNYWARRKIIGVLREAVSAYIAVEPLK